MIVCESNIYGLAIFESADAVSAWRAFAYSCESVKGEGAFAIVSFLGVAVEVEGE